MNSQFKILTMTKKQVHQYLVENIEKPTVVKMALQHPSIDVCYKTKIVKKGNPAFYTHNYIFKWKTPIYLVFEKILNESYQKVIHPSNYVHLPDYVPNINSLLESAMLMVKHHTYNKNFKYEYNPGSIGVWTTHLRRYGSRKLISTDGINKVLKFMKKGFTLENLVNDDKLINEFMEIGYKWYTLPKKNALGQDLNPYSREFDKTTMKATFKKVKQIINTCPKCPPPILPTWIVVLVTVVITLVIGAGGFYGKKVLKPLPNWALVIITIISAIMLGGGGFYGRKTYVKRYK